MPKPQVGNANKIIMFLDNYISIKDRIGEVMWEPKIWLLIGWKGEWRFLEVGFFPIVTNILSRKDVTVYLYLIIPADLR